MAVFFLCCHHRWCALWGVINRGWTRHLRPSLFIGGLFRALPRFLFLALRFWINHSSSSSSSIHPSTWRCCFCCSQFTSQQRRADVTSVSAQVHLQSIVMWCLPARIAICCCCFPPSHRGWHAMFVAAQSAVYDNHILLTVLLRQCVTVERTKQTYLYHPIFRRFYSIATHSVMLCFWH